MDGSVVMNHNFQLYKFSSSELYVTSLLLSIIAT
jgi:hypothetical protein